MSFHRLLERQIKRAARGRAEGEPDIAALLDDPEAVARVIPALADELGGLDRVIVNAGIGKGASIGTGRADANRAVLHTNVLGAHAQCEAAMEVFRAQGAGHLVLVSSVASVRGMRETRTAYGASKAAVNALGEGSGVNSSMMFPDIFGRLTLGGGIRNYGTQVVFDDLSAKPPMFGYVGAGIDLLRRRNLMATPMLFRGEPIILDAKLVGQIDQPQKKELVPRLGLEGTVNGVAIGRNTGAYLPFDLRLPRSALKRNGTNRLVIRVDNRRLTAGRSTSTYTSESFRVGFDETLSPFVVDASGKQVAAGRDLDEIRRKLATKFEIRLKAKDRGQIVIGFDSNDDFERVLEVLRR